MVIRVGNSAAVEPISPDWFKRWTLRNDGQWLPLVPNKPVRVPGYTTAELPSAAAYPETIAFDRTAGRLVVSDGTNWVVM